MEGTWVEDEHGNMWIIPQPGIVAEIEGPDIPEIIDVLAGKGGAIMEKEMDSLGLSIVADHLKRWSPEDGYYHA
jgi:hypothetical protein